MRTPSLASLSLSLSLSLSAALLPAACGGGGGGTVRQDLASRGDMKMLSSPDLWEAPDLTPVNSNCTVDADYGDLAKKMGMAEGAMDMSGNAVVSWITQLNSQAPEVYVLFELYAGAGVFSGSKTIKPGTYTISGDEANYKTCGVCVRLAGDVEMGEPKEWYMATEGTVTITSASGTLKATMSGIKLTHVEIAEDFESTPLNDGCNSAITNLQVDDAIASQ